MLASAQSTYRALAFHALAYFIDGRQLEDRKTAEHLAEEKKREASKN